MGRAARLKAVGGVGARRALSICANVDAGIGPCGPWSTRLALGVG